MPQYKQFDQMEYWKTLPLIPRDHNFKNIPLDVLDDLGWRWDGKGYYIPYFSRSKQSIPFSQTRHLTGDRRFTMLKDAKPTLYGTWNLDPGATLLLVEGTSDCAVLDYCGVGWIGAPSAASGELVKAMAVWARENGIQLVYAGDNDTAGDKLREALDTSRVPYRVRQPRKPYKDWGDMFEAEGREAIVDYVYSWLDPAAYRQMLEPTAKYAPDDELLKIQTIWPGAKRLNMVGSDKEKGAENTSSLPS